jgi:hypothetical protein
MKRFLMMVFSWLALSAAWISSAAAQTVDTDGGSYGLIDRFRGVSIPQLVNGVIRFAVGIVGVYFLLMFIWGGFIWMTAQGSSEKTKQAKSKLTGAVIGLVIVVFSYILVSTIIGFIGRSVQAT